MSADLLAGHPGHLTPFQQDALTKLKSQLESSHLYTPSTPSGPASQDDSTLLRFLRARRFDLPSTIEQFSSTEKWRKDTHIEELYDGYDVEKYVIATKMFPSWTGRRDRDGYPFYVFKVKDLDDKVGFQVILHPQSWRLFRQWSVTRPHHQQPKTPPTTYTTHLPSWPCTKTSLVSSLLCAQSSPIDQTTRRRS